MCFKLPIGYVLISSLGSCFRFTPAHLLPCVSPLEKPRIRQPSKHTSMPLMRAFCLDSWRQKLDPGSGASCPWEQCRKFGGGAHITPCYTQLWSLQSCVWEPAVRIPLSDNGMWAWNAHMLLWNFSSICSFLPSLFIYLGQEQCGLLMCSTEQLRS